MTGDQRPLRVLFAGGGTGGHIHPNLAILERLLALRPDTEAHFVLSNRPIDARVMESETVPWTASDAAPLSRRPRGVWRFIRAWGPCLRAARALIREVRPAALVTTGGFVSAPVARAARLERVPVILIALDDPPGKASRLIARHANRKFLATFAATSPGWDAIPPIVRLRAIADDTPSHCRERLGLDPNKPTLFITGGSQGARSLNETLIHIAPQIAEIAPGWQIYHQCGTGDILERLEHAYTDALIPHKLVEYCIDMADAWGGADLAIARAGAGTVAEVARNAVPTIFLPYPYHADQHQKRNASPLVNAGGAIILDDTTRADTNAPVLTRTIGELVADEPSRQKMKAALKNLASEDGAETVAKFVASLDSRRTESDL